MYFSLSVTRLITNDKGVVRSQPGVETELSSSKNGLQGQGMLGHQWLCFNSQPLSLFTYRICFPITFTDSCHFHIDVALASTTENHGQN